MGALEATVLEEGVEWMKLQISSVCILTYAWDRFLDKFPAGMLLSDPKGCFFRLLFSGYPRLQSLLDEI